MARASPAPSACRPSGCAALLVAVLLALLFDTRTALAQPAFELTWTAPAGCPDRASVLASVERLVTTMPAEALFVTAVAHEDGDRWTVELEMSGAATGSRTLHARSCASVARATALIVALALDPQASLNAAEEPAPPEPIVAPPGPPVVVPPPPPPPPAPPEPSLLSRTPRAVVFAGASAERALVPGIVAGALVGGGVIWQTLRVDLAARFSPSTHVSLPSRPSAGADLSAIDLALRSCLGRTVWHVAAHGCATVRASRLSGEGSGVTEAYRESLDLFALEPSVLVRFPARSTVGLELDAAAVIPLVHPDFVIANGTSSEALFRVSAVGARVILAASVLF